MAEQLTLIGFRDSVYTRVVRMALIEMGLTAEYIEVNPFADTPDPLLAAATPFGRVPVLRHDDFTLSETAAILRYLDTLSANPSLIPQAPHAAARMAQVIGIVDAYVYVPMVRQVFSHAVYRAQHGLDVEAAKITDGLAHSVPALRALDAIAAEGLQLASGAFSLADLQLAPMMAYFTMAPQGAAALAGYPALASWWAQTAHRPSLSQTDPFAQD
jgi:glutathione S-transferase